MTSRLAATLREAKRSVGKRLYSSPRWRTRMMLRMIQRSELFDADWVRAQLCDPAVTVTASEYLAHAWYRTGISPNPLLEPACVPVSADTDEPITAYLTGQVRHVHPLFDERRYLSQHPDAEQHPGRAIGHFIREHRADNLPNSWQHAESLTDLLAHPIPRELDDRGEINAGDLTIIITADGPSAALVWSATSLAQLPTVIDGSQWQALLVAADPSEWRVLRALAGAAANLLVARPDARPAVQSSQSGAILACRGTTFDQQQLVTLLRDIRCGEADAWAPTSLGWDHYILDHGCTQKQARRVSNQGGRPPIDRLPHRTQVDSPGRYVVGLAPTTYLRASQLASSFWDLPQASERQISTTRTSAAEFSQHETNRSAFASGLPAKDSRITRRPQLVGQLRCAIRIAAPSGELGDRWGDVVFAKDLAEAISDAGHLGFIERADQRDRAGRSEDNVTITIRGLERIAPASHGVNILWIISHPATVSDDELAEFDLVFAASKAWAAETARRSGVPIRPLLQATNPRRFTFDPTVQRDDSCLFVGNSRNVLRPIISEAIEAGVNLRVYGHGWRGLIPTDYVAATHVPADQVGALYQRAGVVLNDQWPDMAESGFVVNRLFDALATGAPVISTPAAGVAELFGNRVRFSNSAVEFLAARQDLANEAEADRQESARWVAQHHTFHNRFAEILAAIRSLPESRPSSY